MALIALESFDGVDSTGLTLKGWNNADGAWSLATSSPAARTGSNYYRSNNNNGAIRKSFTAATTVIFGFAYYAFSDGATHPVACLFNDVGGNPEMRFELRGDNAIDCLRENTGVVVASSPVNSITRAAWHYVEIKCTSGDGTGAIAIRVDGIQVLNATGLDTHHDGSVSYTGLQLGGTGATGNITGWDDVYICDSTGAVNNDFLGDIRVRCLTPSADGNSSQWVGSDGNSVNNYALVDEVPQSTTDYVTAANDNDKDTYNFSDIPV